MQFLIVDDDSVIAESLGTILSKLGHECLGVCTEFADFPVYFTTKKPEIVLIGLKSINAERGLKLAGQCVNYGSDIIFLVDKTDSNSIKKVMEFQPLGCILKPFSEAEIFKSIEIAKMRLQKNHLLIKDGHDHIKLNFRDIVYLKADNVYTEIVTRTKRFLPRIGLSEVHANLLDSDFFKVHRSYVVNLRFVDKVAKDYLILRDERVPLSRSKKTELLARLS